MLQVFVIAFVKIGGHIRLYHQFRLDFDFYADKLVHENRCADLRADVHTKNRHDFGRYMEGTDEKIDADHGLESKKRVSSWV